MIGLIALGDIAAFEIFFRRHHSRLVRFLVVAAYARADVADELVNETMHVIWRNAASFRGEARVSTWMHGIALRRASRMRRRLQVPTVQMQSWHEDICDPSMGVEPMERAQLHFRLSSLLRSLPPAQRVVVELAYFQGHSMTEIATITQVPVGTVKTRLSLARTRLRLALELPSPSTLSDEKKSTGR